MKKYYPFDSCVIRTPLFTFETLKAVDVSNSFLSNNAFRDALYIATPVLFKELYVKKNINFKTINSAIKYFSRSCTRCTPYGAFAGCGISAVRPEEPTSINITKENLVKTYTRIDMNYLCEYIRKLELIPDIRKKLTYHLNTTAYFLGKNLRYIQYTLKNTLRKYRFSEIECIGYLRYIINAAKERDLTIKELTSLLTKKVKVDKEEALEFINLLIEEQILVSNLEPSVAGDDLIFQIVKKLEGINVEDDFLKHLILLTRKSDNLPLGSRESVINALYQVLSSHHLIRQDSLIQVDCYNSVENGIIGKNIIRTISKSITVLSKLCNNNTLNPLKHFKEKFYDKYEEQEIPLTVALDTQVGIGYGKWNEINGDINPLLAGLPSPVRSDQALQPLPSLLSLFLEKKYDEAIKTGSKEIEITDDDLNLFEENEVNNGQYCAKFSVISNDENPIIQLNTIIGDPTSRLISRFEYLDPKIEKLANEINGHDVVDYKDFIVAEIMHLPEDRIGNIQMHPKNRKYGIAYLSNPCDRNLDYIIPIDDIMISVPHGQEIVLRSKKLNKRIIPMLSTAHNYSFGLPIYNFLCDYINQHTTNLYFDWGPCFERKAFLPRVRYQNIILSPAKWVIMQNGFLKTLKNKAANINELQYKLGLPNEVVLTEGDNNLYINFSNKKLVDVLINEFSKKKPLVLEEFLYDKNNKNLVNTENSFYTNEVLLNLYKQ
jgi:lantibiotic dehydratase domain protein